MTDAGLSGIGVGAARVSNVKVDHLCGSDLTFQLWRPSKFLTSHSRCLVQDGDVYTVLAACSLLQLATHPPPLSASKNVPLSY